MSDQTPDTKPGNYYVTVRRDGGDYRLLSGPYRNDHAAALAMVDRVRNLACEMDPRAHWYGFGTARVDVDVHDAPGILDAELRAREAQEARDKP